MDDINFAALALGQLLLFFFLWLLIFGASGGIAALVAPADRRWTFFVLTFLLFGPLGVALAAVANPRPPKPLLQTREYYCRRCAARNFVGNTEDNYQCWQCGRDHGVLRKSERASL